MFLQNSQFVIEILLMVVLIAGIVSSRLIVRRLGVIRESYTALNEMVSTLDSSTEQVNHMFERVRHEVSQGDKRLSVLLERARNMEEDLQDQKKMAMESSAALSDVLNQAEERHASLKAQLEESQSLMTSLQEQMKARQEALEQAKAEADSALDAAKALKASTAGEAAKAAGAGTTTAAMGEGREDQATSGTETPDTGKGDSGGVKAGPTEDGPTEVGPAEAVPHFSDTVSMAVPGRLRQPRPYLRNKGKEGRKQAV